MFLKSVDYQRPFGVQSAFDARGKSLPLQYLRGIAALSVMLFHASFYLNAFRNDGNFLRIFEGFISAGQFGVTLFFVTSGALMAQLASSRDPSRFLLHRIVRIYPIYLIVAATMLLMARPLATGLTFDPLAFGLVPGGPHIYGIGIEWTLPFEITFYLIVFCCMMAGIGHRAHFAGAAWIAAIVGAHFLRPEWQLNFQFPDLLAIPIASPTISFAAGMLVPWIIRTVGNVTFGAVALGVPMLVVSALDPAYRLWWDAAACTCFVAAALTPLAVRLRPVKPLAKLGDWSYAIYLCHVPIIVTILRFAPVGVRPTYLWAASVVTALAVGCLVGVADIRLYAHMRRWVDRTPAVWRWGSALAFAAAYVAAGVAWG